MWQPTRGAAPDAEEWVARTILSAGWVAGTRRLSLLDLRVWAALCAQLHRQLPEPPGDDQTLDRASVRTVALTGYQLADAVHADDGSATYRKLYASLGRLASCRVTVDRTYNDPELASRRVERGILGLVGDIWLAGDELDLTVPAQRGALHGTTSLQVEIGRWAAQQVVAGQTTWLDLDLLRRLGTGLAARTWTLLEAWGRWPTYTLDGFEETAIGLGTPALSSLGVTAYARSQDARRALDRAGEKIMAEDPGYELVRCERRLGWTLVVRRVRGAKGRAKARQGAVWRSGGIAAQNRSKAQRQEIRAALRASLGQ